MRELLLAFALPFTLLALARAQERPAPSQGTYTTYVAGQKLATEAYTLTAQPDGTLRAEAEITPPSGATQKLTTI